MRILMLSWEYPPHSVGGMGRHVTELSAALAAQQAEVVVLTPHLRGGPNEETTPEGVRIIRVNPPQMGDYGYLAFVQGTNTAMEHIARSLADWEEPFDLIHAHDWLVADAAIALKHAWRRPLVATIHATERGRQQGYINGAHSQAINQHEWRLTYEAWRVIVCSRFMAEQISRYFQTPADKIDVVPNGITMRASPFQSVGEQQAFRRRFVRDDEPLVFYVGRIVYEKGVHQLIEAWPEVLARQPQAHLVVAGTGDQLDAIRQQARSQGLIESISFTGFISDDDRERLYRVADVAAFPSLYEPFGIVALEAMAAGCPVVVASTGGLAEVVRLHETGIAIYPNNPGSLAWGILHTIEHPEWSQIRARQASEDVERHYNWAAIAMATYATYRRVVAEWRAAHWGAELVRTSS
ncbi:MAG: glycosyltransferase family 4 protein [Roseiflexaceae bacterium]